MRARRSVEEILGGMAHHIEILERTSGDLFSVQRLRSLHDELTGAASVAFDIPQARVVVPFPQNISLRSHAEAPRILAASKRNPDSHLGAEGA